MNGTDRPRLLATEDLRVGYNGKALLPPVSMEIRAGEFWALVGRNGSGKTTWFRTVLGLVPSISGRVVRRPGLEVAYVGQRMSFDDLYGVTVNEVVSLARIRGTSFLRAAPGSRDVETSLKSVHAWELKDRTFRSLSEGQKQRVLLGRMVASGAQLAFLDEPTAAMDAVAELRAIDLIDELRREYAMAVVVVTHHLSVPRRRAERVLFFDPDDGEVVAGTTDEVWGHPAFRRRYGHDEITDA